MSLDRVIHEPSRLKLVTLLYVVDEADFLYLSDQSGFSAGNLSSHMAKLEAAGYVEIEKEFVGKKPRTVYRLSAEGRRSFEAYRDTLANMLDL
mgnify:CR=1 FL=1